MRITSNLLSSKGLKENFRFFLVKRVMLHRQKRIQDWVKHVEILYVFTNEELEHKTGEARKVI